MLYLQCSCCCFLAVVDDNTDIVALPCPQCIMVKCDEDRKFELLSKAEFMDDAELDDGADGVVTDVR